MSLASLNARMLAAKAAAETHPNLSGSKENVTPSENRVDRRDDNGGSGGLPGSEGVRPAQNLPQPERAGDEPCAQPTSLSLTAKSNSAGQPSPSEPDSTTKPKSASDAAPQSDPTAAASTGPVKRGFVELTPEQVAFVQEYRAESEAMYGGDVMIFGQVLLGENGWILVVKTLPQKEAQKFRKVSIKLCQEAWARYQDRLKEPERRTLPHPAKGASSTPA